MYGPGLKVIAGEDGSLQMINGNYADAVTIGNLRQLILLSGTEGNASEEPVAAWRAEAAVDGTGQLELFLDGSTGEVLAENSLLREAGMTEVTLEGESGTVQEAGYGTGTDVRKAMMDE